MALKQSSKMKMLVVFLAIMVFMSSAAAVSVIPQDFLNPINLGRKLLQTAYPGVPSGAGKEPCC
ncbi:hypothetical protein COLO4_33229 [Corchorus olitorius]|uniref:Transmembrane protein n=1 Tax=Corchorus olitorius TaxID=93759 RepID=A0A1R3GVF8_9ROSI|nr:hypothetical protein COLO4_33229 [Corchorus olitorius]